MMNELKEYLSPALQNATDRELATIGVASFGSNLGFLESEHPEVIEEFCRVHQIQKNKNFDRKMLHYITTQVEPAKRSTPTPSGLSFTMNKKPTLKDILLKAKNIKRFNS